MGTTGTLTDISEAACMEEQVHILTALEQIAESQRRKKETEEKPVKQSGKSVT